MRAILWTISLILIVIDVFDIGAKMEKALVDTADHIDVHKERWARATLDESGKETPYSAKWGGRAVKLMLIGSAILIGTGVVLKFTDLLKGLVDTAGTAFVIVYALGLFLFACLYVVTAAPHVLGVFAVAIKWLARQKRGVIGSVGLGIGVIGLFF